jgi:hypothetical protein
MLARKQLKTTKIPVIVPFAMGCIRFDDGAFDLHCEAVVFTRDNYMKNSGC